MTEKRYDKDNPRFRDEFGCVNDLMTGESYLCGENGFAGERDAIDTAIALCTLLNGLHEENQELKKELFETKKDYLIETADISDKLHIDEDIENERKRIYGNSI